MLNVPLLQLIRESASVDGERKTSLTPSLFLRSTDGWKEMFRLQAKVLQLFFF